MVWKKDPREEHYSRVHIENYYSENSDTLSFSQKFLANCLETFKVNSEVHLLKPTYILWQFVQIKCSCECIQSLMMCWRWPQTCTSTVEQLLGQFETLWIHVNRTICLTHIFTGQKDATIYFCMIMTVQQIVGLIT